MHHSLSVSQIDGTTADDAEDLDLVIPMYHLLEYSSNYSDTASSLWFFSKDEATNFNADIEITNDFKSFKSKLLGNSACSKSSQWHSKKYSNYCTTKRSNNFWRSLEMPLIARFY